MEARAAGGAAAWRDGAKAAWPICVGYVPIGLAFGVLAEKAGLGLGQVALMSVLVFAGSAQFIAVGMLQAGAAGVPIVLTTFMVNLRHLLMSSALAPRLRGAGRGFLSLFAYGVTDESFAVNAARFRTGGWDRVRALAVNQWANLCWVLSTVAGARLGRLIPAGAFGVDYALPGMFLCLLTFQLHSRLHIAVAALSGALALGLYLAVPGNAYVVGASVAAATAGLLLSRRRHRGEARR
ncbi:MAG: AzlC family ABC transporter permease [Deferrisomatales bacterium]